MDFDDLLKYDKKQKYCHFDLETANLNLLGYNLPWQLGFVVATRDEILERHNILIKWPNLRMSEDAARITRFDEGLVRREGIDPREALDIFEKYLYDPAIKIGGFNIINFDIYVHNIWRKELGLSTDFSYTNRLIDCRALYLAYKLGIQFNDTDNPYLLQKKMLNFHERGFKSNLAFACKEFGIFVDETRTHDGLYDVELTHELMMELFRKVNIK